jgi:hypothetical protein
MGSTKKLARLAHGASGTRDSARPHTPMHVVTCAIQISSRAPHMVVQRSLHDAPSQLRAGCRRPTRRGSLPPVQRPRRQGRGAHVVTCPVPGRRRRVRPGVLRRRRAGGRAGAERRKVPLPAILAPRSTFLFWRERCSSYLLYSGIFSQNKSASDITHQLMLFSLQQINISHRPD